MKLLDLGCREKLASDMPKPSSRRAVMSRAVAPPCSMSVTLPAAEMFCSSCDSVSSDAKGSTCRQLHMMRPLYHSEAMLTSPKQNKG